MIVRLSSAFLLLCIAIPIAARPQYVERRRGEHYKSLTKGDGATVSTDSVDAVLEAMRQRAAKERMFRDLSRLRDLRVEIASLVAAGGPIDYTTISKQAGEIKKRTKNLKKRLLLANVPPTDRRNGEIEIDVECLPDTLTTLCSRLGSFVENSLFVSENEFNVPEARQAFDDVTTILDLADGIQRAAERIKESRKR